VASVFEVTDKPYCIKGGYLLQTPFIMVYRLIVFCLASIMFCSCIPMHKTVSREAEMNAWLAGAEKPVTVRNDSASFGCAVGYNCYTLIDQQGQTFYARNIRMKLPRMMPETAEEVRRWRF
jgi:hypothetical protein